MLHSHSLSTLYSTVLRPVPSCNSWARTPRKTPYFLRHERVFIGSLPRSKCPTVPRVYFCVNMFSEQLPSNGHKADHTEKTSCNTFSFVACEYFCCCLEMGLRVTIYIYIYKNKFTRMKSNGVFFSRRWEYKE